MPNLALIVLTGHLGRDAELKNFSGADILKFSLAVTTGWGEKKRSSWYECAVFGKQAVSLADKIHKGDAVTVVGEPTVRKWESNGKSGTTVDVRVNQVVLLGGKSPAAEALAAPSAPSETSDGGDSGGGGEVPF